MKKKLIVWSGAVLTFAPLAVFAQQTGRSGGCDYVQLSTIQDIICRAGNIIDLVIPLLVLLGVLLFVWGVVQYVIANEEEAKTKGRDRMIAGIVGLAVILSMWGLVGILKRTFGIQQEGNITLPKVPF